jgi:hypothetical protein
LRFQENFVQFIIFQHYRFVFYYFFSWTFRKVSFYFPIFFLPI